MATTAAAPSSCLLLNSTTTPLLHLRPRSLRLSPCRASSNRSLNSFLDIDFDLYDLLGVDSSSTPSQIKLAYRSLQKRCHPDIAGSQGHDMSIILNQAYSVLSDPVSRFAYDKEQAKTVELRGYNGKPLYSVWLGPDSEERAVFVDEVKCVGCLKCALCAEKTFAIESVFGRARVVAQWADPEHKIQEAIDACPVNCISVVERTDLAALEFLMSKQPRGNVRVGTSNTGSTRVSNIFVDVKKFQVRFTEARDKAAASAQSNERALALQAIRSLTSWLYWQSPNSNPGTQGLSVPMRPGEPDIGKLRHAATSLKARETRRQIASAASSSSGNEYWVPSRHALPPPAEATPDKSTLGGTTTNTMEASKGGSRKQKRGNSVPNMLASTRPVGWSIAPICMGFVAGAFVNARLGGGGAVENLKEHVGGSLALEVINSGWLRVGLAGITWYMVGVAVVGLVGAIIDRAGLEEK
ncbi:hypothetical protein MLD38_037895 [Melastoma candidum]|uniref:Uncharacterized protein n=1 Tax=Melastoma candidum TaxID=119954 RepID=A0ACB9KXY3_9MYRT|nr:hypothetical protein MLD38_037895 [Melastoma candidum]